MNARGRTQFAPTVWVCASTLVLKRKFCHPTGWLFCCLTGALTLRNVATQREATQNQIHTRCSLVGAFCERPRANAVRPYGKKDREFHVLCPFSHVLQARCSVLHLLDVLSGGNEPPFTQGSFWFVRVPKGRLLFLTSTAFVDTKAKPRARRGEDYRFAIRSLMFK